MNNKEMVSSINNFVKQFTFFEFSFYSYSNDRLIIAGSSDFLYYHNIEIHIINPFFVSSKSAWIVDTKELVIEELEGFELNEYNQKNKIEVGNYSLKFYDQDGLKFYFSFGGLEVVEKVVKYM